MSAIPKDRIEARAHEIWVAEGRPDGRADKHWLQAERELGEGQPTTALAFPPNPAKAVTPARVAAAEAPRPARYVQKPAKGPRRR